MARYSFYKTQNHIICVSHYAGRPVRGIAKCSPEDTYDEEFGKVLAQARCDEKIARKRFERAQEKFSEAVQARNKAEKECDKAFGYLNDAAYDLDCAIGACRLILETENSEHPRQKEN